MDKEIFSRSLLLMGGERFEQLRTKRVILFGVGGVGSWCAESLVRTGICHLTIVDSDHVAASNCNRQLMATTRTIGQVKVEVLRNRLLEINPDAEIVALEKVYNEENASSFELESYDFIIDAIDSLKEKAHLILHATGLKRNMPKGSVPPMFVSSMGAALKIDPTKVRVAEFWNIKGDPLARAIRNRFKRNKEFPASKFLCVYSEETPLPNVGAEGKPEDADAAQTASSMWDAKKAQTNGSLSHITGIFGMTLAGLVVKRCYDLPAS